MILALESSCDETAIAAFSPEKGVVANWTTTQTAIHERHGGVVPDLATREHLRHFGPLIEQARHTLDIDSVETVAVTRGPGLAACLALGLAAAKALGLALRRPVVGVNHLRAHAWSPFIPVHAGDPGAFRTALSDLLPHLGLLVSGGNTLLLSIEEDGSVSQLATTRDDAAGEALDKGAKLLGLGYPGGPRIEALSKGGNPKAHDFPRALLARSEPDFSFSGLKTSLRYLVERLPEEDVRGGLSDLCASYQAAVVDSLVRKTGHAIESQGARWRSLGLSGGVANNGALRAACETLAGSNGMTFLPALPAHTGDNAAMIAFAAWADEPGVDRRSGMSLTMDPSLPLEAVYL